MKIFEYSKPHDLLERLNRQYDFFIADSLNEDKALDFCLTAWSLADWVFYAKYPNGSDKQRGEFREKELYLLCKELKVMHDIANGTKHFMLSRPKLNISDVTVKNEAAFNNAFSFGFDASGINLTFENEDILILNLVIDNVHKFWNGYIHM